MSRLVRFDSPRSASLVETDLPPLAAGDVRIRTLYSGISAGTELTIYRGTNPYINSEWDSDRRLFLAGSTTWSYPIDGMGYEEVGVVTEVGDDAPADLLDAVVWGAWGHRSHAVRPADYVAARRLPPGLDPMEGIFAKIGAIALNAVLDADIHLGETVVVFGGGVPGQIVSQLAALSGARVVLVDLLADRRELAERLGAFCAIDPAAEPVAERVRALTDGRGADVVIEMSGSYQALHEAIRTVAYSSRVVVSGFFQGGADPVRLGEEFHHNRVQITGSQISGVNPALQHRWSELRMSATVLELARAGRLNVRDLVTDVIPDRDAPRAFRQLDERPQDVLQMVLDYSE